MWTFIFYSLFLIGLVFMILAMTKVENVAGRYWLAGCIMYIVSFLGSWSIGLYLLVIPAILFMLALAHSFGWVNKRWQNTPFAIVGIILWYLGITYIDDYWLFLPFVWLI